MLDNILTTEQINQYQHMGFLVLENCFSEAITEFISVHCEDLAYRNKDCMIIEENGDPYSIYLDQADPLVHALIRSPQLLNPVQTLLNPSVYVHQIKLNHKKAMHGSEILWHEDYIFWHHLDKVPKPELLTVALLLDDVYSYNSPLMLLPQSHHQQVTSQELFQSENDSTGVTESWSSSSQRDQATLVSDIRFKINQKELLGLASQNPIFSFTGKKGSILFFHARMIHGSTKNISPYDRRMLFITFNQCANIDKNKSRRSSFIAYHDNSALSVSNQLATLQQKAGQ